MTFETFIMNCMELLQKKPELANATVVCGSDEEGNTFDEIEWKPTYGIWLYNEGEFYEDGDFEEGDSVTSEPHDRAVCVN